MSFTYPLHLLISPLIQSIREMSYQNTDTCLAAKLSLSLHWVRIISTNSAIPNSISCFGMADLEKQKIFVAIGLLLTDNNF